MTEDDVDIGLRLSELEREIFGEDDEETVPERVEPEQPRPAQSAPRKAAKSKKSYKCRVCGTTDGSRFYRDMYGICKKCYRKESKKRGNAPLRSVVKKPKAKPAAARISVPMDKNNLEILVRLAGKYDVTPSKMAAICLEKELQRRADNSLFRCKSCGTTDESKFYPYIKHVCKKCYLEAQRRMKKPR